MHRAVMASPTSIDLDEILWKWGEEKLGAGYTVDKIDTTKVKVSQMSVLYQSSEDWFITENVQHEVYDNPDSLPITWSYAEKIKYPSQATWTLIKGFKSSLLPPVKLAIEYPLAQEGQKPLAVLFDGTSPDQKPLTAQVKNEWEAQCHVTVKGFSTTRVCAQLRTCKLNRVLFTTDIHFTGQVRISGHKKRKSKTKLEVTAPIEDAFLTNPSFQILSSESDPGGYGPTRKAQFRVEGWCDGDVGLDVKVTLLDLQTTV